MSMTVNLHCTVKYMTMTVDLHCEILLQIVTSTSFVRSSQLLCNISLVQKGRTHFYIQSTAGRGEVHRFTSSFGIAMDYVEHHTENILSNS